MPATSVPIATIHESAAKRRRRLAADSWPCVARHYLVTSTGSAGSLSGMLNPLSTLPHDGARMGRLTRFEPTMCRNVVRLRE